MKYAIIGSGKIGTALARTFARKKIEVAIANSRGPETLASLTEELGPCVVPEPLQDAHEAEMVFLAVPFPAHKNVAKQFELWNDKIVVDLTNAFNVAPFSVRFESALREDLQRRLSVTRWSDAVTADWQYGMKKSFLQQLVEHWQTTYNFDAAEERINVLPQFRTSIAGFCVHYVHVRGRGPRPLPLLLMNGWPSSFVEYRRLAPMLADPAAFGGSTDDAFDVIMPALPGFGFSDRPAHPHQVNTEELFHRLMTEHLGYVTYIASGTDIGAGVATRLALKYPQKVKGIHISSVVDPPLTVASPPLTNAEKTYKDRSALWEAEEGAYEHVHYTKPQTLAFALADSPAGLASWILEKFYFWSDHDDDLLSAFPLEMLIDNLMIYWATETIGSSIRLYYDHRHFRAPFKANDHVNVPTAACMWPRDLMNAPREWAERFYNVQQYSTQKSGGHFPAWEAPNAYAHDVRRFAKLINGA